MASFSSIFAGVILALGSAAALAAGVNVVVLNQGGETNVSNPLLKHPLARLSATLERPLFEPGRREPRQDMPPHQPPAPAEAVQALQPEPLPNFVLTGVISAPQGMIAMLSLKPNPKVLQVRMGEVVAGWKVIEITALRVVMERGPKRLEMAMFQQDQGAGPKADPSWPPQLRKQASRN